MKRNCIRALAIIWGLAVACSDASALSLIIPRAYQTNEGVGGSSLFYHAIHLQNVYSASLFPPGKVLTIRELRYRPSAIHGAAFSATIADIQMNLSTTSASVGGLSGTFANNVGANDTVVFNGSINLSSAFTGPANGPKAFDIVIPLTTPFRYDPSQGNLLIDYRNRSGSTVTFIDSGVGNGASRAFALGGNSTSAESVDEGAEVVQLVCEEEDSGNIGFDLSRDFAIASGNPNGVWSYGWQGTLGGAFTLFTHSKYNYDPAGVPIEVWDKPDSVPSVQHNNSALTAVTAYGGNFPPETTWFHPGVEGQPENFGVIRFTAPSGGTYDLATTVRPVWDSSYQGDSDFHVLKNGTELFGRALAGSALASYGTTLTLAGGDTIDFVIGRGADNSFIGTGLKIVATLNLASTNPVPPAIVSQPQSKTVIEGANVTFTVAATGSSPLSYQWLRGGTAINGATASTLMLENVQMSQAGEYSVVVSNAYGVATSQTATLAVNTGPDYDLSRDFAIAAGNPNGVWSYGWQGSLGGAFNLFTHSKYSYDPAGAPVEVWDKPDSVPAVQHNNGTSTVITDGGQGNFPPETTWFYPGIQGYAENYGVIRFTVPSGKSGTYDLATTVRPAYNGPIQGDTDFHVLKNGVELFGRALAAGASAGYSNSLVLEVGETIDLVIGRGADNSFHGSGLKIVATLDLGSTNPVPPTIISQPASQTVIERASVTFRVSVNGSSPLSYQWLRGGTAIDGATASSLTLNSVQSGQAGEYRVVVTNAYGAATSAVATLTIIGLPENAFVIPKSAALTETPFGSGTFVDVGLRNQQVYGSVEFPPGPIFIQELRFRPDVLYGGAFAATVANFQLNLSTTTRQPNALSSTFAQNVGVDDTVVFQGPLSISSQFVGPAAGPKAFDIIVPLSQPFYYDPALGNLVVDVRNASGSSARRVGGQTGPDSAARVVAVGVGATSGGIDDGADAIQVIFSPATNVPPTIVSQPQSDTVFEGASVTLRVGVSGSAPLSYQWFKGGTLIEEAAGATLILNSIQVSQSGQYFVVVSNAYGVATSQTATVTVNPRLDYDLSRDFEMAAGNPNGPWSYGWKGELGGEFVRFTHSKFSYDPAGVPVEVWDKPDSVPAVQHNNSTSTVITDGGQGNFPPETTWFYPGVQGYAENYGVIRFTVPSGKSGTYDLATTVRPAYGVLVQGDTDFHVLRNGVELFGRALAAEASAGYSNSLVLEVGDTIDLVIGRGADNSFHGSGLKIEATLNLASTNPAPPTIISQPASQTVELGTTVSLSVGVRGSSPFSYQWRFNGANLPQGTNSALVLEFAQQSNAGQYQVVVTNPYGSATSTVATVTVHSSGVPPTISSQPNGGTILAGNTVTLNVQALGTAPLSYQWFFNGAVLASATSATLTIQNAQPAQSGSYWVVVSNAFGSVVSRSATVNIQEGTQGGTVLFGNFSSNLVYDVDGITPLPVGTTYLAQLYGGLNANSLAPFGAAVGFVSPGRFPSGVRTISSVPAGQMATVQVKVWESAYGTSYEQALAGGGKTGASDVFTTPTGGAGSPPSLPERLTGLQSFALSPGAGAVPPEITSQPVSRTIQLGESTSFSVTASGPAPLLYQWRFNGAPLAGATGTTLSITNAQDSHAGAYSVVVRNNGGAVTSQVATLTVETSRVLMTKDLGSVTEGDLVVVPIDLKSEGDVAGMSFVLRYNPDFLSSPLVEWGSALDGALKQVNETALGELRFVFAFGSGTLAAGTQSVATVNLRARSLIADAQSQLALQILDISDASGEPIVYGSAVESGRVDIDESTSLAGDNNANGRLDVGDATLVLRLLALLDTTRPWDLDQNDLNENGLLDSGDAVKILRAVAGAGGAPAMAAAETVSAQAASGTSGSAVLTPSTVSGNPGSLVTFQVRLQGLENPVAGASFTLNYPAGVLRLRGAQDYRVGALVPQSAAPIWNVAVNGQVRFAASSSTPWPGNNGVLAELTFEVMNPPAGQLAWPLTLSSVEVTSDGYELNALGSASATFSVQPQLVSISRGISGSVNFSFNASGGSYRIEASTNLINWVTLTNVTGAGGSVYIVDPQAGSIPRRFYRARIIP